MDVDDEPSSGSQGLDDGMMDVDRTLFEHEIREVNKFLAFEQNTSGEYHEMYLNGGLIYQQIGASLRCETTSVFLDEEKVAAAMRTEYKQLTDLAVGELVTEQTARSISSGAGTKIIPCRWVLVQKSDGRVRARIVAKDLKAGGLSAFREELYAPTA